MKTFPATAIALRTHIRQTQRMGQWVYARQSRENGQPLLWQFWVDGFDPHDACVSFEHRRLWVNVDHGDYYFELNRLHEDYPAWSWRQQLAEKGWASAADFALLDALAELFPVTQYGTVRSLREAEVRAHELTEGERHD